MLQPNYSLLQDGVNVAVVWLPPQIPAFMAAVGWGLAAAGLAGAVFRRRLAARFGPGAPERVKARGLLAAGLLAALAGAILAGISGKQDPLLQWRIDGERLTVKSLNGEASFAWKDVRAARLDSKASERMDASLVLADASGKELWLILKWLAPAHRLKILSLIGERAPEAMKPVLEDRAYFDAFNA